MKAKARLNEYGAWDVFFEHRGDSEIVIRQEGVNRFVLCYDDGTDVQCLSVTEALNHVDEQQRIYVTQKHYSRIADTVRCALDVSPEQGRAFIAERLVEMLTEDYIKA